MPDEEDYGRMPIMEPEPPKLFSFDTVENQKMVSEQSNSEGWVHINKDDLLNTEDWQ